MSTDVATASGRGLGAHGSPGRGRLLSIALIVGGQSFQALASGGIALFLPLIRTDLGLSFAQAGTLAAASTFVYALMQVPSGLLSDRFDPKRLFVAGLLGTNLATMLLSVVPSYPGLLAVQAGSGFFRALVFAPGLMLIRTQFPDNRRATAMGLFVAGGFSSSIALNLLGPLLVGPLGWRALFAVFGALGLATAIAYHWAGTGVPRRSGHGATRVRWRVLRHRVVWLTGLIQFVRLALVQGSAAWLPTYVVVERGQSLSTAGLVVALGAAVTAPANMVGGWLSDRLNRPLAVIGGSLAVLAATFAALPAVPGLPALLAVLAVQSVFIQVYFGPLFAVPMQYVDPRGAGLVTGFGNFCANLGGFACTYLLGALMDATGSFATGFGIMAGMAALALATTLVLARWAAAAGRR
ncbi:MFS transporter [Rhizomonospora bruguierae]|uniref:MFS transporter n=1 Tax=Rhizomonospora bruguierae TaxID=1581705 RepID=UPI0020BE0129|nr:MFS transporter [Micromonospora sp. NBRC 107566]